MTLPQQPMSSPGQSYAAAPAPAPAAPAYAAAHVAAPQPIAPERYNLFSLVSFIGSLLVPVVGIVFGHVALRQIGRTREAGRGFALAGLWIGYGLVALIALFWVLYGVFIIVMMAGFGAMYGSMPSGDYYS